MQVIKKGKKTQTLGFYKKNGLWYADLPEFLALGLGTKANLLMVDGSDTFLDLL
jgi:prepilin-type processing-associated H-X9-DG protein